jgi:hypothetical protein
MNGNLEIDFSLNGSSIALKALGSCVDQHPSRYNARDSGFQIQAPTQTDPRRFGE